MGSRLQRLVELAMGILQTCERIRKALLKFSVLSLQIHNAIVRRPKPASQRFVVCMELLILGEKLCVCGAAFGESHLGRRASIVVECACSRDCSQLQ